MSETSSTSAIVLLLLGTVMLIVACLYLYGTSIHEDAINHIYQNCVEILIDKRDCEYGSQ